jgi:hypothetical protein
MKFQKGRPNPGFKKGQSGNPGGKPKAIIEVAAAARALTAKAISTLEGILDDAKASASARAMAAVAILDRGWGKASQTIDVQRKTELRNLTDDELIAIAGSGLAERSGETAPATSNGKSKPH